jgi:NAD(P)H-dependent FMN reductase
MSKPKLQVIVASTRPGRVGPIVAEWFVRLAEQHGGLKIGVTELAELALPMMDEPHHPKLRNYQHEHSRAWSAIVDSADAFVFVMPEYNYTFTAPLKNAIDYLHTEWKYKPVGFVSYGGISGGLRAVQQTKLTLTALKVMPIVEAVSIHSVHQHLAGDAGQQTFAASEQHEKNAAAMLDELHKWAVALKTLRA